MKNAIQFGAGNIGRGFIGALLAEAGYQVLFSDVNPVVINALRERGEYTVEIVGSGKAEQKVGNVDGCFSDDDALLEAIAGAEIITTAVGPTVLPIIAKRIAAGIVRRAEKANTDPLNIIACENQVRASSLLRDEVLRHLPGEHRDFMQRCVGFPDCAVDRIIPPMEGSDDPLRVRVEEFSEWIVDRSGFVGEPPDIRGMQLTDTLLAYVERKLFTLNTGHAITAYLGAIHGYSTIEQSIADGEIAAVVRGAMKESGEVLIRRHGFDRTAHAEYIEKIINRFRNPWLKDEVQRVGRQPLRKLGVEDRLIKPLRGTIEYNLPNTNLIIGIAAALYFRNDDDEQALQIKRLLKDADLRSVLPEITSIRDENIINAIESAYEEQGVEDLVHNYVKQWTRIVSMQEATESFPQLVKEALAGREVIVAQRGRPMIRLTPVIPPEEAV